MFGYRLVPLALFDVMLEALKGRPEPSAVAAPEPAPEPEPAPRLSPAVEQAAAQFAFGDRAEKIANLALARHLAGAGYDDRSIVAAIRAGGSPPQSAA